MKIVTLASCISSTGIAVSLVGVCEIFITVVRKTLATSLKTRMESSITPTPTFWTLGRYCICVHAYIVYVCIYVYLLLKNWLGVIPSEQSLTCQPMTQAKISFHSDNYLKLLKLINVEVCDAVHLVVSCTFFVMLN